MLVNIFEICVGWLRSEMDTGVKYDDEINWSDTGKNTFNTDCLPYPQMNILTS